MYFTNYGIYLVNKNCEDPAASEHRARTNLNLAPQLSFFTGTIYQVIVSTSASIGDQSTENPVGAVDQFSRIIDEFIIGLL